MCSSTDQKLIDTLNEVAQPLSDRGDKYAALLEKIGDGRFVLKPSAYATEPFDDALRIFRENEFPFFKLPILKCEAIRFIIQDFHFVAAFIAK